MPFNLFIFDVFLLKLDIFVRFLPIIDVRGFPKNLNISEKIKWTIMDTFDAFSMEFDNTQRLRNGVEIF